MYVRDDRAPGLPAQGGHRQEQMCGDHDEHVQAGLCSTHGQLARREKFGLHNFQNRFLIEATELPPKLVLPQTVFQGMVSRMIPV